VTFTADQLEESAQKLRSMGFVCSALPPYYLPASTAAAVLLVKERTLRAWRAEGRGPAAYPSHGRVLYRLDEVLAARVDDQRPDW
jgi:hypothetical protein